MLILDTELTSTFLQQVVRREHKVVADFLKVLPEAGLKLGSPLSDKLVGTQTTFGSFRISMADEYLVDLTAVWQRWCDEQSEELPSTWYTCRVWHEEKEWREA